MIETMISIAIFLVVIIYGTASLLNAYSINRKSQDFRSILDSLSFVMEDMSRNIRTGSNYVCLTGQTDLKSPTSCQEGSGIAFESSDGYFEDEGDQWVYLFSEETLFKSTLSGAEGSYIQMIPDEVAIDSERSNFSVLGAESPLDGDKQQPLVTIKLVGTITSKNVTTPFSLQTSVSQRLNDI